MKQSDKYINCAFFFDIDDTLVSEVDYIDSALAKFAEEGFADLAELKLIASRNRRAGNYSIYDIINSLPDKYIEKAQRIYREGKFDINPIDGALDLIKLLKDNGAIIGIISDGWSIRQRNKLKYSGIEQYIDYCYISEECNNNGKITGIPFMLAKENCREKKLIYIGDNPAKDFVRANESGWLTVMVRNPKITYIHSDKIPEAGYAPDFTVTSLSDLPGIIC